MPRSLVRTQIEVPSNDYRRRKEYLDCQTGWLLTRPRHLTFQKSRRDLKYLQVKNKSLYRLKVHRKANDLYEPQVRHQTMGARHRLEPSHSLDVSRALHSLRGLRLHYKQFVKQIHSPFKQCDFKVRDP